MGKGGSVSVRERMQCSEDAPVNAGAVQWPDVNSAFWTVRRMQIKLHRWASEDPARRFGDLFNLVYDRRFWCTRGSVCPATPGRGRREWIGPRWLRSCRGSGGGVSWPCPGLAEIW
jgi:hypothetical protein